jgi:oxygen-independent coproporphyrinogen-3 oxidase
MGAYVQAVRREAQKYAGLAFDTIYVGGGTPSLLGAKHFNELMDGLREVFVFTGVVEATIEVNPESAKPDFLEAVKNAGFNRISFGVQSLSDNELRSVGRIHTAAQAIAAVKLAKKFGFKAVSADLMIGLPGQSWTSLHKSVHTLVEIDVQHLSVYCLSLEEGTVLANNPPPDIPTDDLQVTLFEKTRELLISCGFTHYEISNFAQEDFQCLHNLNYWRGGEYLGLGPAAASHLEGRRFKNRANLDAWLENPTAQIEYVEILNNREKAAEEAMLRLRLLEEGIDSDLLIERFGEEDTEAIIARLDKMVKEGLLIQKGARYRLTPSRVMTSNPIFARVLSDNEG